MNFFLYQPESFLTINAILGQMIGQFPLVSLWGAIFIVLLFITILLKKRFAWPRKNIIIVVACLVWLPLFIQFLYSSIIDFKNIANFIDAPEEEQINWRFCSLDKNYHLGGGVCNIYPFAKEIESIIPLGANIHIFSKNIVVYLKYYLYGPYRIVDLKSADYFIIYRSDDKFIYEADKLYNLKNGEREYLGDFTILKSYDSDTVVFKRKIK